MKQTIKDIIILIIVFLLVFVAPHYLHLLLDPKEAGANEYRGCVASAHQATRHGHNLQANLNYCNEL
jgi:hypothetical protein